MGSQRHKDRTNLDWEGGWWASITPKAEQQTQQTERRYSSNKKTPANAGGWLTQQDVSFVDWKRAFKSIGRKSKSTLRRFNVLVIPIKASEVVVHSVNWCPKIVNNSIGSYPEYWDERTKEEEPVISGFCLRYPDVWFLHVFNQGRFDEGCLGQSAAQCQGQWQIPSLPSGHSTVLRGKRNRT